MEALIIVTVLLIFWTQQVLFAPSAQADKPDEAANLAKALEEYLKAVYESKNKT